MSMLTQQAALFVYAVFAGAGFRCGWVIVDDILYLIAYLARRKA